MQRFQQCIGYAYKNKELYAKQAFMHELCFHTKTATVAFDTFKQTQRSLEIVNRPMSVY